MNHPSARPGTKVIFYSIKDNGSKLRVICLKAEETFRLKKKLLILVPSLEAAQYVDALLWRMPEDSFLPHAISDEPTSEWIAITIQSRININQAPRLLNLCSTPCPFYQQVQEIYDLYDETDLGKTELSKKRVAFYQSQSLMIKQEKVI